LKQQLKWIGFTSDGSNHHTVLKAEVPKNAKLLNKESATAKNKKNSDCIQNLTTGVWVPRTADMEIWSEA
jgi:hypothetical protein